MPPPRPSVLLALATVATLAVVVALLWVRGGPGDTADTPDARGGTPLRSYDTAGVVVPREEFCDRLPEAYVEDVLGEDVTTGHYGNGDTAPLAPGVRDVSHEYNCTFTGADGGRLRAWVFVPPVAEDRARRLARRVRRGSDCTGLGGAPDFGRPSIALACGGEQARASFHGLFGDAWLSCSLRPGQSGSSRGGTSRPELVERAGEWCVQVVDAIAH